MVYISAACEVEAKVDSHLENLASRVVLFSRQNLVSCSEFGRFSSTTCDEYSPVLKF